jgi:hypothetical protein
MILCMKDILQNQVFLAMIVFIIIVIGAYWRLDSANAKEIIVQVITAIGALVTGVGLERWKCSRSTDNKSIETEKTV